MRYTKVLSLLALLPLLGACAIVDATEHCVKLRYGKVLVQKAGEGINNAVFADFECFPLTQRTYPQGAGGEDAPSETVIMTTQDSVQLSMALAIDYKYTDAWEAFQIKREHSRVLQELSNAIRSGSRNAGATLRIENVVGVERAEIENKLQAAIQEQIGKYIAIERVYVRDLNPPAIIVTAWGEAAAARAGQQKARDAYVADSLEARRTVVRAQGEAEKRRLEIQAMATSPAVLALENTKAFANGLANALKSCTNNCIIGDGVLQKFLNGGRP